MLHSVCGLSFLREMESRHKDPISPQCTNYSNPLQSTAKTRNRKEMVLALRKSICKGVMIFAARPALTALSNDSSCNYGD
jgi:hypothetical protein